MKLADSINKQLISWCSSNASDIVIPNFFFGGYEMDVFKLMPSGYVVEYEIKVSKSDFLMDFKKGGGEKHGNIKNGKSACNRFFFVLPEGVVETEKIPKEYGVIFFEEKRNRFWCARTPKLLHKEKVTPEQYRNIAHKLAFRESMWRWKVNNLQKILKEKHERL